MDNHNIKCCACKCVCVCVRVGTSTKCNTKFSSNQKRKKINASQPAANNEHSMLSFCCCWCAFRRSERRRWIRWRFCYELLSFLIPLCFFFRPIGKSATDCARLIFNLDPSPTHWLLNIRGTYTVRMWAPGSKKVTWKHSRKCTFFSAYFLWGLRRWRTLSLSKLCGVWTRFSRGRGCKEKEKKTVPSVSSLHSRSGRFLTWLSDVSWFRTTFRCVARTAVPLLAKFCDVPSWLSSPEVFWLTSGLIVMIATSCAHFFLDFLHH